jgi:hypothetical protein
VGLLGLSWRCVAAVVGGGATAWLVCALIGMHSHCMGFSGVCLSLLPWHGGLLQHHGSGAG